MSQPQENIADPMADRAGSLRAFGPFAEAAEAPLQRLAQAAEWRQVAPGQAFELPANAVLACVSGMVRLIGGARFQDVPGGEMRFLEEAVARRSVPAYAGAALYESIFAVIPASAIADEAARGRSLAAPLAAWFASRLIREERGDDESPARKLYGQLAMLAQPNGADGFWKIAKMPRHRELASGAGMSEEDAANAVAHLISTGVARRDFPGLEILDYESLRRLAVT